ncbi:14-3-3 protein [Annulohypoxylon maeteangense]|uniref:14-3-3 protein n=1 Tax=Annulohypoxylon maeteangense TaxID=1927788 RepID=UPI0020084F22|nr:14-3-3 protein [Annulohypoxylon maeteangense]KAI0883246.1 14-3-3 protein [Annulohypoxylon maeteangense]
MASSEVDQKFLGRLAKSVEPNNALLASMLFKILGLSINVAGQLVKAKKQRRLDATRLTQSLELYFHIIWLSREGLVMLEQYVLPMVGDYVELKVLAYKLRASFYHIFVQFHNNPPVSPLGIATTPEAVAAVAASMPAPRVDKGKGVDRGDPAASDFSRTSVQPTHALEQGMPAPPPGFESQALPTQLPTFTPEAAAAFLLPYVDYLPTAHQYFREACALADGLLWGSHSLRLSVKTEYAAFLYECVHDREGSRKLAKDTIAEVYEASEGMDDDMFNDACELVTVLGKMMKRGLGSGGGSRSGGRPSPSVTLGTGTVSQGAESSATVVPPVPPLGMENPI